MTRPAINRSVINFEQPPVRRSWDAVHERWLFAVVDVVAILTDSPRPRKYWNALKTKLIEEGSQLSQTLGQLKLRSKDGKNYLNDVADTPALFRIIQSIPSPKAEPLKQWLAKVGYERIQETANPELAVDRARRHWQQFGRSHKWIEQRMRGQETRNTLTDYWQTSGVKEGLEYATLTDIIHQEWSGLTTKQHKTVKGLKTQNLRDNMTEAELIFTALAELSTTGIATSQAARGYAQNAHSAKKGGRIAGNARVALETETGTSVVSAENFLPPAPIDVFPNNFMNGISSHLSETDAGRGRRDMSHGDRGQRSLQPNSSQFRHTRYWGTSLMKKRLS